MTLLRLYLLAIGVFSLVIGLVFILWPAASVSPVGLELSSPASLIEVRGFYGGQLVAMGGLILLGLCDRRFVLPALLVASVPLAGTAAGRLVGVVLAGTCPPIIAVLFAVEAVTAAIGLLLVRRELATPA